jgi:ribulose kinase
MLAAVGAGLHPDVPSAASAMAGGFREPVLPDAERRTGYATAYRRYRELYAALRPLF